ncbi:hypothetical protein ED733_007244 [Metarhizium rileyi]|uniref:SPIN90/Ldb17 leucine-rich domain-containing protein n=1 Tax=Metarhizium rileyi (strain RCEF 4871) TaxID=1649241 RepID=A0A5C6GK05_METRR|nr:hypothetical protein ED733_007244 [Metarhizium rileyi]
MEDNDDFVTALGSEDEHQLWSDMNECLVADCTSHESIDDTLREWLEITNQLRHCTADSHDDFLACAHMLLDSGIFKNNKDYVRTQIIHSLLQEDEVGPLHAITSLLFLDGCSDESTFPRMIEESCFPRLLELIIAQKEDADSRLHRLLLQLMYEMSRVERLNIEDLSLVDDVFVHHLFQLIESVSEDVQDPYHYPTIRVLLVLNEQYMLASTDSVTDPADTLTTPLTNRIVKCLSLHGSLFRTFGENLLYLLFTTKATYEYFYTNDLRVLLDVMIRNLMDLPDEKISLRHTYLRVMYPLLAHTQLNQPPHYKRDEILRVLRILRGSPNAHFAPADETTIRLVARVAKVTWIEDKEEEKKGCGQAEVARKFLGISLSPSQYASSISVVDVAGVRERPGVQTPSRNASDTHDKSDTKNPEATESSVRIKKPLPTVPQHRHGIPVTQAAKILHGSVNGEGKRIPPQAPPPRRWGRRKSSTEQSSIEPISEAG